MINKERNAITIINVMVQPDNKVIAETKRNVDQGRVLLLNKKLTFGFLLQQENGTPQASLLPTSRDEQLK